MRFYVSKCHDKLNGIVYDPERISDYVCVNPYYNVTLAKESDVKFMIDSGAFQDVKGKRVSFEEALKRQLDFEKKITEDGRPAECIVSYDRLVDEQLTDKGQIKKRVDKKEARDYVRETINAAKFLSEKREELRPRKLILSCQGISVRQYLYCLREVLKVATEDDIIGFGGFCIISKSIDYERDYYEIIEKAFPKIKEAGIKRVHIFGLGMFRALVQTDVYGRMHGIECSYDTSSPEINAVFGKVFNPHTRELNNVYSKNHKGEGYKSAELALFNVKAINNFWELHRNLSLPQKFKPGIVRSRKTTDKRKPQHKEADIDENTVF